MSEDGEDEVYAKLAWAIERVNLAEQGYRRTLDELGVVEQQRESVLAEAEATRQLVRTVCDILIKRGQLVEGHRRLLERIMKVSARPTRSVRLRVIDDKHEAVGPDIDCASRLPLCRARCCTLQVELAREDLEDGIRFDIDQPYMLRHDRDGWCHYIDRTSGGCTIYDQRPTTCRKFDCRTDPRVWIDFDARIPAPLPDRLAREGAPRFEP